jgi:hypothetical protein
MDPIDDLLKPPSRVVILNVSASSKTCVKHVFAMCIGSDCRGAKRKGKN